MTVNREDEERAHTYAVREIAVWHQSLTPMGVACDDGIIGTRVDLIISRLRLDLGVTPESSLQSHREREARIISLPGLDLHVTPE